MKSFVITSDCDHLLAKEHLGILRTFAENGIFITTAVFARVDEENSWLGRHCNPSETHGWENAELRKGLLEAQSMGHEIAFHGTSQCSNTREEFIKGIEEYKTIFGDYPFTYIEHGPNPDIANHIDLEFKSELLANKGSDQNSPFFVKDIIQDTFGAYWSQKQLLSLDQISLNSSSWSNTIEEINYVKRARMLDFPHFKKEFSRITDRDLTYIGYTHFGYEGFFGKRREFILNAFRPLFKSRFEFWKGMNLKRNVKELANFLNKNEIRSTTLKDLIK